jgi:hypothetical protein
MYLTKAKQHQLQRNTKTTMQDKLISTNEVKEVRFQVLIEASIMMTIFWDVASCSLVEIERRFTGAYCLHHQDYADNGGSK